MAVETGNTKKLEDLIKPHRQEFNILQEALKEVAKEDGEKRKDEAKGLIRQALDLKARMDQAERTFNGEKKKFDKQLGKLMNKLNAMANGRPVSEVEEEEEDKEKGDGEDASGEA